MIANDDISGASDLFELGMVLYEMLVGEPAPTATQRLFSITLGKPDLLNIAHLEQPWRSLLEDALQLRIEQRSTSIQYWWNQAQTYWKDQQKAEQNQPTITKPPEPTVYKSNRDRASSKPAITNSTTKWTAALVTASVIGAIGYLNFAPKPQNETLTTPPPTVNPVAAPIELPTIPCNTNPKQRSLPSTPTAVAKDNTRFYGNLDSQNRLQGEGTVIYSNGARYDGNFLDGKPNGCGRYDYAPDHPTLKRYVGEVRADHIEGLGVLSFKNGNQYIGEFKQNRCQGNGVFILSDGTRKAGTWTNDESEGNPSCKTGV